MLLIIIFYSIVGFSKSVPKPAARFTFNNKTDLDEISGLKVKMVGVSFTQDRFGNKNNAIYLYGNPASYLNFGTDKKLKPEAGSISLWVKIENPIWSGSGHMINPFIMTKRIAKNDFYESYIICYFPETKKVAAWCSQDSLKQIGMNSVKQFESHVWHHLVITYDFSYFSFYIDGKLESSLQKNFTSTFLNQDSVVSGITANKKNFRYSNIIIDDVEFYHYILNQEDVVELYNAPNPNRVKIIIDWLVLAAGIMSVSIFLLFIIRKRIKKKIRKERERLELINKQLETELRVNRASMNPHFLFNSLNTLNSLILSHQTEKACDYLVRFSKLIRGILETNMFDSITLSHEIELLEKYLELENIRFDKNIKYFIEIDENIIPTTIHIPLMLIQPFIENSIWHGLINKPGDKNITISFKLENENCVLCIIEDNGLGRISENTNKQEKKSLAISFIIQRLELLNKIYKSNCKLIIHDKPNHSGTIIKISIPILPQ